MDSREIHVNVSRCESFTSFFFLPFRDFSEMIPHLNVLASQSEALKLQSKLLDRTWTVKMPKDGDEDTVKIISEINLPRGVSVKLVTVGLSSNLNLKSSASYVVLLVSNLKVVMSCTKKEKTTLLCIIYHLQTWEE